MPLMLPLTQGVSAALDKEGRGVLSIEKEITSYALRIG